MEVRIGERGPAEIPYTHIHTHIRRVGIWRVWCAATELPHIPFSAGVYGLPDSEIYWSFSLWCIYKSGGVSNWTGH